MIYEIITDELTQSTIIQKNNLDGSISYIPMDENNLDYQVYCKTQLAEEPTND